MTHKISSFLVLILLLSATSCLAQKHGKYATSSKKAIKLFEGAIEFYNSGKTENAEDYLYRAIKKDSDFVDAYLFLGDINSGRNNLKAALNNYRKALEINPNYYPKANYLTAMMEMELMLYEPAAQHLRMYLQSPHFDQTLKEKVMHDIDVCDFSAELMKHPVAFDPKNLGENINTSDDEYVNAINTENNMVIFTVRHSVQGARRKVEDFFYSRKNDSLSWQKRKMLSNKFNTEMDEGAMAISPDGKLIVFASNRAEGYGRFDLYYSEKQGSGWSNPKNMGEDVNTKAWESQPTISSDGKTIYFVSDRRGGYGGSDIYFVTKLKDGSFGNPMNLGPVVNSSGNEMTPFIHQDDHTLYFVSNGHLGMGGSDIFYSRRNKNGLFQDPVNMGYPINSNKNELGLVVDAKGSLAYVSSDKYGGFGYYDIYSFELYEEARPIPVTYFKGIAYDKETKQKLQINFDLIDLETEHVWLHSISDKINGEFLICIPQGKNFLLNAYKDGYLFYSDNFQVKENTPLDSPFVKNIPMIPIKVGESIVLENIFFATNSYDLRPESQVELKKLLNFLIKNPSLKVEIAGHTDNVGEISDNLLLSENRAKAVYDYLISQGVIASRLTYAGYGESKPIASNKTNTGRQRNRRTEMKIISN